MANSDNLKKFTNLYQVSKTLRFELIPQGKTLEHIEKNGLLEQDEHRAESYILVKKIIDEYHKAFISGALENLKLNYLEDYLHYYQIPKRSEDEKKKFDEMQTKLRKQIADCFTKHAAYKNLFAKELIKEDLKAFVQTDEDKKLVEEFDNFTTYFTGFHENRKNMYSAEEKSTAIAFRLIHQNLPKFIDNMRTFEKVGNSPVKNNFQTILSNEALGPIVQVGAVEDMFTLEYFNETLTQKGIDIYNQLIGGYTPEGSKEKIKGLNEYINLYNQTAKKEERIPKLKPLYKQILSDRSTASYIPEQFTNDNEVLESIEKFYQEIYEHVLNKNVKGEHSLKGLLGNIGEFDLHKVYLRNDLSLTDISQKMFGDWGFFQKAMNHWYDLNYKGKAKHETEKYEEEQKKYFRNQDSFSVGFINDCLLLPDNSGKKNLEEYFKLSLDGTDENGKTESLFVQLENNYNTVKDLLNNPYPQDKDLAQDQTNVDKIKTLLDSIKAVQWFIKPLLGKGNEAEKDERFYGEFSDLWTTLDQVTPLYNKVRNYMTRKPYSTEKYKLNFESSYLLNGWAKDYETKAGLIFIKDNNYYLAINNKKFNEEERNKLKTNHESNPAKRIILDFQKPDNKNIPRLFIRSKGENFAPAVDKYQLPIDKVIDIYDNGKFKTEYRKIDESDYLKSLHILIDYFKEGFTKHDSYKHYSFAWKTTKEYKDIAEFYNDVEVSCYKVLFEDINWNTLIDFVEQGKLYLFQIYNKDFSPYSKGTPNMHTLYWKMLFDEENLKNVVYKLNGQAEVFFRRSSIKEENKVVHKAGRHIDNKNEQNEKKQSRFEYDIIKDRRYTVDKFQFHVPLTLNFKAAGINNINKEASEFLKKEKDIHIIGIDRGERHLLYLTLIDSTGNIKQQFSLNEIINEYNGKTYKTDYHALLDKKEGGRDEARRNWKTIENIKELKEGYLSQVIHKISELMVTYNAIVVLEDLNTGFMRGRQKVEKQVYQKFEKMLIDKLNYLITTKDILKKNENGGALNAYQFTESYADFMKYKKKQCGFLFYVPAWNTSKMDPVTGFVNLFDTRYENMEKAKTFFGKFKSIKYNQAKNYFEFDFDYADFTNKAEGTKTRWTLCTYNTRIETFRNPAKNSQWDNREIVLTGEFINLFNKYGIEYNNTNIKDAITSQTDKAFYERLLYLLKLTLQMRNSITGKDTDYLVSPVAKDRGDFYDSRTADDSLPKNADANGAYNIARKGLWVHEQLRHTEDLKKLKLAITNKEWLHFAQNFNK